MNKAESDSLEILLRSRGWEASENPETAELVIINTCSVRKTAEDRIWGRIGFFKKLKQSCSFRLVIIGCMAQRIKDELYSSCKGTVDLVLGPLEKSNLVEYLEGDPDREKDTFPEHYSDGTSFKAFVPIMKGCNNFCSYCIVPYVRGREISRDPDAVIRELKFLDEHKVREVTFLGQNVNSYRGMKDGRLVNFATLLKMASDNISSIGWLRFMSSHPKDFSSELIDALATLPAVCHHIHIPVQHGSDRILEAMNRRYTAARYLEIIDEIREKIPDISLTTDILIGFPGETEKDFEDTLALVERVRYADAYTYYYNPREGTKAYDMPDMVPLDVKLRRLDQLITLQRRISAQEKEKKVGRTVKVLVESVSKKDKNELLGRTEGDDMVVFPGKCDKIGSFMDINIVSCIGNTFKGEAK